MTHTYGRGVTHTCFETIRVGLFVRFREEKVEKSCLQLLFVFLLDVLVLLDDVVSLVNAEFASLGEVGNGEFGVVEEKVEETTVEIGFGKGVVLSQHLGETVDYVFTWL